MPGLGEGVSHFLWAISQESLFFCPKSPNGPRDATLHAVCCYYNPPVG